MTRDDEGLRLLEEFRDAAHRHAANVNTPLGPTFDAMRDAYDALRRHLQGEDT